MYVGDSVYVEHNAETGSQDPRSTKTDTPHTHTHPLPHAGTHIAAYTHRHSHTLLLI